MHCLRHLAILSVLVPFPSTSPYVLLLVAMVAYMAVRPCGYCLATLAVVFFSTSASSPFLAALAPETAPAPPPNPEPKPLSSPIPDRGAFFLNGGRIFDPALEGYAAMQRVWDTPAAEPEPEPEPEPTQHPPTPPAKPLPKWYHDLRLGGVGLVLDFGWRRTDEGLAWELEQQKHAAELARYRRGERQRPQGAAPASTAASGSGGASSGGGGGSGWAGVSFLNSW